MSRWIRIAFVAAVVSAFLPWTAAPSFAATITVSTTDGGSTEDDLCSLPEAVTTANTNAAVNGGGAGADCVVGTAGADTINFAISPGSGVHTIALAATLSITEDLTINGYSETGASQSTDPDFFNGMLQIVLDGPGGAAISIADGPTTIRGLVINSSGAPGAVLITSTGNTIAGNFIGTNATGTAAVANTFDGVHVEAASNTIGGSAVADRNVISGNTGNGVNIDIEAADSNVVRNNLIGTNATGLSAIPNGAGVRIDGGADGNTVGGSGNLISGNVGDGVHITGGSTTGNVLLGNLIGTDRFGTGTIPNGDVGVEIASGASSNTIGGTASSARNIISANTDDGVAISAAGSTNNTVLGNRIGTTQDGTGDLGNGGHGVRLEGDANTIGGTASGAGNLLSGNSGQGLVISSNGNTVQGNFIGTNAAGTAGIGNGSDGIRIGAGATLNQIGGTTSAAGNLISANPDDGIQIGGAGADANAVQGNFIGTNAAGTGVLGNGGGDPDGDGVVIFTDATSNLVGGAASGAGNLIANNDDGVRVTGGGTDGNSILGNSIHSNNELGIDIATDGVNPNDAGDADTGSNQEQNFPNVASATSGSTTVTGTLNSVANQTFRIEAFWSTVCDPSGNGEGANFLGSVDTSTNGAGNASWTITSASTAPNGSFVSTTATRLSGAAPDGDTSEFSGCHVVTGAPGPGPGPQTLEVTPETDANPPSTAHTMTATVSGGASVSGVNVDGEIITGPNTNQTPAGPDLTCTTGVTGTCTATYTGSATQGTDVIRFHIDANNDSAIPGEADATEGQDELVAPGAVAEPDVTDVVSKSFTTAQTLNLEPESDTNPPSTAHTITATVGGGGPIASQNIDAEIISGPNANLNPAGPDLTCTSSASGTCTMTYTGGTGTGTDLIRGHIDANNDNAVPGEADTAEGRPETTTPGTTAEPDTTDVVEKIWAVTQPPPPAGCVGTAGNDILVGTNGPDNCRGRAGNDTIRTKGGRDTGRGGSGNDTLRLGAGNDSGFGGSGNDRIFCGPGRRDQVRGGPGNDRANRACEFGRL